MTGRPRTVFDRIVRLPPLVWLSAFFLLRNLYPVLSTTEAKTSKALLIVVLALHAGFAIAIKVLFFAATSPIGNPKGGEDKGEGKGDMMFRF